MDYNQLDGMFLTKFFTILAVIGEKPKDKKHIFHSLAQVYCLSEGKENALYRVVETEEISSIQCLEEYVATMRALDYQARFGIPLEIDEEIRFALDCKGKALKSMYPLIADCGKNPTKAQFKASLSKKEIKNLISVAFVAAFMSYEGFFLAKNIEKANGFAKNCADWNSMDGLLLLLRYGEDNARFDYKEALMTLIKYSQAEEEFVSVINEYGLAVFSGEREENLLIAKYTERVSDAMVRESYDESASKIAKSSIISASDKERIFDSGDRAALSVICGFAYNVRHGDLPNGKHIRDYLSESRYDEANQAEICLRKQNTNEVKIPVLVCRNKIVSAKYYSAIKNMVGSDISVVCIDARICSQSDLSSTKGNFVVKTIMAERQDRAVFVITDVDKISAEKAEYFSEILNPQKRRKYMLQDMNLTLDLSKCAFLLMTESENVPDCIRNFCQTISTANVSPKEIREYIQMIIDKKKAAYECPGVTFSEEAISCLENKDADRIIQLIEVLCRTHSLEEKTVVITKADVMHINAIGETSQMAFQIRKQEK